MWIKINNDLIHILMQASKTFGQRDSRSFFLSLVFVARENQINEFP